jgi:hypothetical protein
VSLDRLEAIGVEDKRPFIGSTFREPECMATIPITAEGKQAARLWVLTGQAQFRIAKSHQLKVLGDRV